MAEVWRFSERNFSEWRKVDDGKLGPRNTRTPLALQDGFIRCQVDVVIFHGQEKRGFRVVILDRDGKFMAAVNGPIERVIDPHLAEAIACREAMAWVKERGYTKVHLKLDCLNVINEIKTHKLDFSYSGPIITQCRGWAATF